MQKYGTWDGCKSVPENYPTVNIESLACGTPILTYKTGGSPEIVEDYGGTVVEQGDIIKVLESIKTIKEEGVHGKLRR